MIASKLLAALEGRAGAARVADVRIGLGYTAVLLDDGQAGLGYTFRDLAQPGCNAFDALRPLAGRPARDLLALLESEDVIGVGVAVACANALTSPAREEALVGDVLSHLDLGPRDHVGMVGLFRPLLEPLRERCAGITVFERDRRPGEDARPAEEAVETLPRCQVALITATSLINHTLDELLAAAQGCREVVLLGASTPLLPEVFTDTPVTMLSGLAVREPAAVLQVVSEGGGMRSFGRHCDKLCLRLR